MNGVVQMVADHRSSQPIPRVESAPTSTNEISRPTVRHTSLLETPSRSFTLCDCWLFSGTRMRWEIVPQCIAHSLLLLTYTRNTT